MLLLQKYICSFWSLDADTVGKKDEIKQRSNVYIAEVAKSF